MTHPTAHAPPTRSASSRSGQLAVALQETLTAVTRLRANRQVAADADAFRAHLRQAIAAAQDTALRLGYGPDDVRLSIDAVVQFLDESVITGSNAMSATWARRPLRGEIGDAAGGDFVHNAQQQLARGDSDDLADVLEVYALCLALGFRGPFADANATERQALIRDLTERIGRIRSATQGRSWTPPAAAIPVHTDRMFRPLLLGTVGVLVVAVVLYAGFWMSLRSGLGAVRQAAGVSSSK